MLACLGVDSELFVELNNNCIAAVVSFFDEYVVYFDVSNTESFPEFGFQNFFDFKRKVSGLVELERRQSESSMKIWMHPNHAVCNEADEKTNRGASRVDHH